MIRKRFDEDSGNWHIEILLDNEWNEIGQECTEDDAERIIELLTRWMLESIQPEDSLEDL